MPRLLLIAPAPVIRTETGYILDGKFIEGMKLHCAFWPGEVECILREGASHIPFGAREVSDVGFGLHVLSVDEPIGLEQLQGYDLITCSADDARNLDITALAKVAGTKVVFTIEYILETRLQVVWLDRDRSLAKRLYSILWLLRQEIRLRRAMRQAEGVQANGYPAFHLYGPMTGNSLLYLDSRMTPALIATQDETAERSKRLTSGALLRLVYSGRLESMKGAQDLVPIARILRDQGTSFTLDIFGEGRLGAQISRDIVAADLDDEVRLHAPVDFETELIPYLRKNADIYMCCHRQSDPSCTYLENMGCGLAVAGYGNRMWAALFEKSHAGSVVPMGNRQKMAAAIAAMDRDRSELVNQCHRAVEFARAHDFPSQFRKRMAHLAEVAGVEPVQSL